MTYAEVIGDPIAHSKSPFIHCFWLSALGIDADYRAVAVSTLELAGYFDMRRDDSAWRGCNITLPHKIAALDHVSDPGEVRSSIGAINTVFRGENGALQGTNTDAAGFYAPLADTDLAGKPVVVIGSGGAACAVLFALARMEVGPITVLARSPLKAAALLSRFGLKGEAKPIATTLPPASLLVNASALGMAGQAPLELDLAPLPDDAIVYDIVYAPLETPLLEQAAARGLAIIDGLEMLVGQAAIAFELFFGVAPPRDRDAALRDLLVQ
ncbi:MAG: shikimate dehydrogenase [Sphingomonas sp.]|uniref:shikimate dehydrogenase family protein n=1 Tax=Sphingomonas sp. TaxID=28214 RepID=UPI001790AABC|nr:shikimate dehydrogenase [Zymomonas sp.]MBA4771880.1 shikimate dehydrogenase [Sphingomonas sp.]